jgi:hypothetical protein
MVSKDTEYMTGELESAGLNVPDGFFGIGASSADSFGEGFMSRIDNVMEQIKSTVTDGLERILASPDLKSGGEPNTNINITYTFASSGETISQQIEAAKNASEVDKMRGVYYAGKL